MASSPNLSDASLVNDSSSPSDTTLSDSLGKFNKRDITVAPIKSIVYECTGAKNCEEAAIQIEEHFNQLSDRYRQETQSVAQESSIKLVAKNDSHSK